MCKHTIVIYMVVKSVSHGGSVHEFHANEDEKHIVLGHEQAHAAQYVVASSTSNAFMVGFEHSTDNGASSETIRTARGLSVAGVTRRRGLFRHFVEAAVDDIQEGDRVVVKNERGIQFTTGKINSIQHI